MSEASNSPYIILAALEDSNLIRNTRSAQLVHTQGEIDDGWKGDRAKEVAFGMDHKTNLRRCRWMEAAMFDQICIDD